MALACEGNKGWAGFGHLGRWWPPRPVSAIDLISKERKRQVNSEGWTTEHDDQHTQDELASAAACYAMPDDSRLMRGAFGGPFPSDWPWDPEWWKPTPEDRIRELTKAGALIVAEIERLQRQQSKANG